MKWRLVIRPQAEANLREARDWYEKQRPGLGNEFLADISLAVESLLQDPRRYPEYYRGFRRILTRRFPFKIFYRFADEQVIVFRVLHGRRDHGAQLSKDR